VDLVPEAVAAGTPMGRAGAVLPAARGAVLTVGGHDHLAAAVGAGAAGEGDVLDSCGTAEAFVRASAPLPPERVAAAVAAEVTVGWHAVEGRQALLGAEVGVGGRGQHARAAGRAAQGREALEAAALAIERRRPGAAALHLDGVDADVLTLSGIGRDASPGAAYHAALEAVGRAGAGILERMAAVAGPAARLVVTGGWAAGEAARTVKRRHLGAVEHSPALSTGARGAALAAGRAAGLR
jgi:sugar (pentulose or hexulose) kinase